MIKSISIWAFDPNRPYPEAFRLAKANGFEAVEVAVGESGPLTPQSTRDDCERVVQQAREAGLQLASLASGLGWTHHLTASDEARRKQAVEMTAHSLQLANWLDVDALLVVPGVVGTDADATPYDAAYDNALLSLQELAPIAETAQVTLGIENVWNKFLLSPLEMRDLVDKIGSKRIGCYFDVGNVLQTGYPEQWIPILNRRIARVHFKDWKSSIGTLDGFCPLLEGDVDYPAVMQALREIGYNGPLTAEFFNCEADLPQISRAMDAILEMV